MRGFFVAFPIRDAVRRELSRTHYRTLLRVEDDQARQLLEAISTSSRRNHLCPRCYRQIESGKTE
jgi:hypothetical protein